MTSYQKLSNQPLVFVLAEFRFSPVLDMEKYIPELQDKLRQNFPLIGTQQSQEFQFSPNGLEINTTTEWIFHSKNRKQAITINHNRLVHITSEYNRFDGFREQCETALKALIEIVKPSLLLRIGLRYNDAIIEEDKEDIKEYVHTNLFQNSFLCAAGHPIRQTSETILETTEGCMVVRSMYEENTLAIWPDMGLPIEITKNDQLKTRIFLDFDHFWESKLNQGEESQDFKLDDLISKLEKMHEGSRKAFWDITTDKGRLKWK
ncbi:MAG: TIGR04255 family protein [Capnocytophaga sp.]|nr:TIGR04255 family protein [Capnocytophaga sp.]